jgi:putative flippase GtrA
MVIIYKFLKYSVVGASGVLVDFGTTWLLKEKLGINKYVANSIGFTVAASSNYYLNRMWTFASKDIRVAREYVLFLGVSIVGLALNNLIIYILNDRMKLNFYISKLVAIAIVTIWNFAANYLITFRTL